MIWIPKPLQDLTEKLGSRTRSHEGEHNVSPRGDGSPGETVGPDGDQAPLSSARREESNGPKRLHPALEVTRDFLLFGFREERITEADEEDSQNIRLLSLVVSDDQPEVREIDDRVLEIGRHRHVIPSQYDHPPLLEEEWSRSDLTDFVERPTAPTGRELYGKLREAVHRHIDFEEEGAEILASIYPAITFVFPAFPAVPFLLFLGPKETGKSQALDVLSRLCRCGHKSRATAASIGDLVESQRATLLLDQADNLGAHRSDLLTDSYRAGTRRTVTNEERRGQPHSFRIYSPKIFAAHGNFDEDLLDRCIQIPMSPAVRHVKPLLSDDSRLDVLRHQLYRYVALNFPELYGTRALADPEGLADEVGIVNRAWELLRPVASMFEWLQIPEADREAARDYFRQSLPNTSAELPREQEAVLRALRRLDEEDNEELRLTSRQLHEEANKVLDSSGDDLTRADIGRILKDFSLVRKKSRPWMNGKRVTEWKINRGRLHQALRRWRLQAEPRELDTSGQGLVRVPCPPIKPG